MYSRGDGVQQDYAEAGKWLSRAAEQGHAQAQALLIRTYNSGADVFASRAEAAKWFRVAAGRGNSFAQYQLGMMYSAGDGVAKNDVEALAWITLSASSGNPDYVKARDRMETDLGSATALRGRERSREILVQVAVAAHAKDSPLTAQSGT
jgi:TPR repeat protein